MKKIAIFASGNGSNAENICNYFNDSTSVEVVLIATNKKDAFVIKRAESLRVSSFVFSKANLVNLDILNKRKKCRGNFLPDGANKPLNLIFKEHLVSSVLL